MTSEQVAILSVIVAAVGSLAAVWATLETVRSRRARQASELDVAHAATAAQANRAILVATWDPPGPEEWCGPAYGEPPIAVLVDLYNGSTDTFRSVAVSLDVNGEAIGPFGFGPLLPGRHCGLVASYWPYYQGPDEPFKGRSIPVPKLNPEAWFLDIDGRAWHAIGTQLRVEIEVDALKGILRRANNSTPADFLEIYRQVEGDATSRIRHWKENLPEQ